jgi:hypothetical protein
MVDNFAGAMSRVVRFVTDMKTVYCVLVEYVVLCVGHHVVWCVLCTKMFAIPFFDVVAQLIGLSAVDVSSTGAIPALLAVLPIEVITLFGSLIP